MGVLLKFARFKDFVTWDVKSHLVSLIVSKYNVVTLSEYIQEETTKIKPFEYPNDDFKILGVSNKVGLFDNEIKKGKDINQAYKVVKDCFLAYNPYRINVGSIGLKTKEQKYDLISPAYVVFSCKKELLPEYLFLIFKTKTFNKIINESTKGSVRQILSFDILEKLKIPLPPLDIQKKLVKNYHDKLNLSISQEKQIKEKDEEIEKYLYKELGIKIIDNKTDNEILSFIRFKDLDRWTVKDLLNTKQITSKLYNTLNLSNIIIGKPKYGSNSKGLKKVTDIRYIRITDINEDGTLNDEIVSSEKVESSYILKQDDFLIARSGNTVGKTFLYDKKYGTCMYAGYLIKFTLNKEVVFPLYLLYYTKSSLYKKWINSNLRIAGQPNINSQEYLNSPIILPPLEIQNKIAQNIQKIKDKINILKNKSIQNKTLALEEFEKEIFNET